MSTRRAPPILALICLTLGVASLPAIADTETQTETKMQAPVEDAPAKPDEPDIASGKATHAWMQAQESGALASKHRPVLTGPVLSKIQANYIKSFESPAADTFSKNK